MRVLIVEDEPDLRAGIRAQLQDQGYTVDASGDGDEGLYLASEYPLDAAIVDLGLPGLSGIDLIRRLRQQGCTLPVLILTARNRWQEKVEGLEAGADDYLTKPFQMEELLARLKALLRRAAGTADGELCCGAVRLDPHSRRAQLDGAALELTDFEFRLLEYLMRHNQETLSKSQLADYLYPHERDRDSNVIEVMIARLRKKLDPQGSRRPIETVRNRGYRFTLCDRRDVP